MTATVIDTLPNTGPNTGRRPHATCRSRALLAALMLALAALWLGGCATNPATGGTMLSFMSPEEEKRIGAQEHPKLVAAFGGEMTDKAVVDYVGSIGRLLARTSELPDLNFTFTVLDTDMVNAFALPGGYVYVTRGLMALANTEAELAGVIAHEIGHVTARHSAQRYSKSVLAGVGATVVGILTGSREVAELAGQAGQLAVLSYSREDEFEADMLGVRYLRRAGFDAGGMAGFLATLRAYSQLEAQRAGLPPEKVDEGSLLATHPRTIDRVQRAAAEAGVAPAADPIVGRDVYLGKIDGMIFGDSPSEGYARGRDFLHPELRFSFRVPEGFDLRNSSERVLARGPDGAAIIFDGAKNPGNRTMMDFLVNVWGRGATISDRETITVNGLPAATGRTQVRTNEGVRDLRLVAIRDGAEQVWRFAFLTPPADTAKLAAALRETTHSFRKVSAAEAAKWQPWRIRLHKVRAGDTVESLAARLPFESLKVEWFRVLNGLGPGEPLRVGEMVKLVVES